MKQDKRVRVRFLFSIAWVVIGLVLISLAFVGKVDEFWNGMGSSLFIIGCLQLLKYHRLQKNETYREKMEIEESDERNHFIRNKTWSWTGYICILTAAVLTIVFKIVGQELLSMASSMAVCYMSVVYWIVYHILKRKY